MRICDVFCLGVNFDMYVLFASWEVLEMLPEVAGRGQLFLFPSLLSNTKQLLLQVNGLGIKKWKFKVITQAHATWPRIPPGLVGKIEKFRPYPEPIRLQDPQNSARSRIEKKELWKLGYLLRQAM